MKKIKGIIGLCILILAVVWMHTDAAAGEPYEKIANDSEWKVLKIVNKERIKQGLEPVSMFADLQAAAGVRADEIKDYFSHERPDGSAWSTAISEEGINYGWAGENIAAGYTSPSDVMNGWMNSPGHRSNIQGKNFDHIGVGYCTGGSYGKNWVQLFVGGCKVKSVSADMEKGTVNYPVGTTIDQMDRYLVVRCNKHGIGYVPVTSGMCSGYNSNKTGYQTITVKYHGKKVKIPVTVGKSSVYKMPSKVTGVKVTKNIKNNVKLSWKKRGGAGYEVWVSTSKNGAFKKTNTLTGSKKTTCKVKNLKSGKNYYIKVRAYKKVKNKKIYGLFSKAVVVKTK